MFRAGMFLLMFNCKCPWHELPNTKTNTVYCQLSVCDHKLLMTNDEGGT